MSIDEAREGTIQLDLEQAALTLVAMNKEKREYAKELVLKLSISDGNLHHNETLLLASLFKVLD
jgi:hypothetical protein